MTRLLLDTNVVLPVLGESMTRLPRTMIEAIEAPDALLHVSIASLWETAIKARIGKLDLRAPLPSLPSLLSGLGMALVNIEASHVLCAVDPEPDTRDPFDRLLLAQCQVEDLRLVTLDRKLVSHPLALRPE